MARVANNADDYVAGRVGIFFPAHNQTPADGNLTGQCVTLIKWFMAEMTSVPSPFMARGHARYVGDTLVNQGHAVEVPYAQRRRGDIAVYKFGEYGHILVVLSGDRTFEQNANVGNPLRRLVDGGWVYASRLGSLRESWRSPVPNIYRIKSYNEAQGEEDMIQDTDNEFSRWNQLHKQVLGYWGSRENFRILAVGKSWLRQIEILSDHADAKVNESMGNLGRLASRDNWQGQIYSLQAYITELQKASAAANARIEQLLKQIEELGDGASDEDVAALQAQIEAFRKQDEVDQQNLAAAKKMIEDLESEKAKATETGNAFTRWIGGPHQQDGWCKVNN